MKIPFSSQVLLGFLLGLHGAQNTPTTSTVAYGLKGRWAGGLFYTTSPSSGLDIVINKDNHEDQFGRNYTLDSDS